jgi:hypothetical protein
MLSLETSFYHYGTEVTYLRNGFNGFWILYAPVNV